MLKMIILFMKKYTKLFALMGVALLVGACQEDDNILNKPALPGDEIVFGATGYLESGDKGTRTIYGDVYEDSYGKHIQVKWVKGTDRMDIACPQSATAGNVKIAEYKVMDESNSVVKDTLDLDEEIDSIRIEDSSVTATLHRLGNAGLQWSAEDTHHFFASYPSKAMITEKLATTMSQTEIQQLELGMKLEDNNATLTGYIPLNQSPSSSQISGNKDAWVIKPDMSYAYMTAKKNIDKSKYGQGVGLRFESQVAALEFQIVANEINYKPTTGQSLPKLHIMLIQLESVSGQDLAGHFTYAFNNEEVKCKNIAGSGYNKITQSFGTSGLELTANTGTLTTTFFLLPNTGFNENNGDLKLKVIYKLDDSPQTKTAIIKKEIKPKKKYFFKDVKLPAITQQINGSTWFSALDDDILVSQVSIPVAANVFANKHYTPSLEDYYAQQTKDITTLWNAGVRGFELCNQSVISPNTTAWSKEEDKASILADNLNDAPMIAAENVVNNQTFLSTLQTLYNAMNATVITEEIETEGENGEVITETKIVQGEPLVLICTYAAKDDGYSPYNYVQQLFNSLQLFAKSVNRDVNDLYVQLKPTSTVEDLMGKIAVIIRPGDDERWMYVTQEYQKYEAPVIFGLSGRSYLPCTNPYTQLGISQYSSKGSYSPYGLTLSLKDKITTNALWDNVLLVSDWGQSSWDAWHRRGGTYYNYASTATNFDKITAAKRDPFSKAKYEDNLLDPNTPFELSGFEYRHDLSNGGIAYIQEWARVIKEEIGGTITVSNKSKTVKWLPSTSEKKTAIDGLFKESVKTNRTGDIYVNSLSGYYAVTNHPVSWYPCYYLRPYDNVGDEFFPDAGKGGDYASLALDMNNYVYGILNGGEMSDKTKLSEGPWGLVMMDYIGANPKATKENPDMSTELVHLIMMNNFKFPLKTETDGSGGNNNQETDRTEGEVEAS